jgi:hypothetical protein
MNSVLMAPTGMWLEVLAPMGIDPDKHAPRQLQAPERNAPGVDAPPNGLHQPRRAGERADKWCDVDVTVARKNAPLTPSAACIC